MNLFELFVKLGVKDEASDKISNLSDKLKTGLGNAAKVATAAMAAATTAIVAFGKSAVDVGKEFDASMSQVAATMGYSVEELNSAGSEAQQTYKKLRDFAQEMGASTVFSAREAADALNYMALAGYDAETSMSMLPNVLNLAAAGSIDLARASDMITDAQTALGLSLDETSIMVDQMAKAASKSNTSVGQLGEAILTIGGTAQFMSGGTDRLATVLGVLADNGIKGSEAGTHLRNMLLKLSAPTDAGTVALRQLGVQVFDAEGKMRDFSDIFGDLQYNMSHALPQFEEFARSHVMPQEVIDGFIKNGGKLKEIVETYTMFGIELVTAEGRAKSFEEVMEEANATFANGALTDEQQIKMLSDIFNTRDVAAAQALIKTSSKRWDELGTAIKGAWYSISGLNKAFNEKLGLKSNFSDFSDSLKDLGITLEEVEEALNNSGGSAEIFMDSLLNAADAGTSMDAIAQKMFFDIDELQMAFDATSGAAQAMADVQLDNLQGDITLFKSALEGAQIVLSDQLTPTLREIVQFGSQAISSFSEAFREGGLGGAMSQLGTILSDAVAIIIETLPQIVSAGGQVIGALVSGIIDNLPELFLAAKKIISDLGTQIGELAPDLFEGVGTLLSIVANYLTRRETIEDFIDKALDIVVAVGQALPDMVKSIIDNIGLFIAYFINALTSEENINKMLETGVNFVKAIATGMPKAIAWIIQSGSWLISNLLNYLGNEENQSKIAETASDIVKYLGDGIIKVVGMLGDAAVRVITGFVNFLKDEDRMHDLGEAAGTIIGRIVSGIIEFVWKLAEAGAKIITGLSDNLTGDGEGEHGEDLEKIGNNILDAIITAMYTAWDEVVPTLDKIAENLRNYFDSIDWEQTGEDIINDFIDSLAKSAAKDRKRLEDLKNAIADWFMNLNWDNIGSAMLDLLLNTLTLGMYGSTKQMINAWNGNEQAQALGSGLGTGISNAYDRYLDTYEKELARQGVETRTHVEESGTDAALERFRAMSGTTVTQNINIYAPEATPSELARELSYAEERRAIFGH